ncbi:MAG TPA: hypothetical protein VJH92_03880 [Candidatus Nanoarchaeia archaeon]|nr:hypothetical protein [Candidatus Nanoarchaeia archaeon]
MTKKIDEYYRCNECLLYYKDKKTAEKCEVWCKSHKSCNLEITKHAIGSKQVERRPAIK